MRERPRFWRWYRTLPILAMLLVVALSCGLTVMPSSLARRYIFPVSYREAVIASSERHGVDPLLVCAIIKCESNWDAAAVSDAGAVGLMQLMPSTSQELADYGLVDAWGYNPADLTAPETNIEYGCAYLQQLNTLLGSTDEVICAYNAGPGSVEGWLSGGGDISDVIAFPETALYLRRVQESYRSYQTLYDETLSER